MKFEILNEEDKLIYDLYYTGKVFILVPKTKIINWLYSQDITISEQLPTFIRCYLPTYGDYYYHKVLGLKDKVDDFSVLYLILRRNNNYTYLKSPHFKIKLIERIIIILKMVVMVYVCVLYLSYLNGNFKRGIKV